MDFFKKNPLFSALVIVCLFVFGFGVYLYVTATRENNAAKQNFERIQRDALAAHRAEIAPTAENLGAAEANVASLAANLAVIRERLESAGTLETTADPIILISNIQRHITDFRRMAEDGEERGFRVGLPENFGFGFDRYVQETPTIPNEVVGRIDLQRQILAYVLDQLMLSNPREITAVQRELIEVPTQTRSTGRTQTRGGASSGDRFTINDALSARVPDAIDTLAFRITFVGYTEVLRTFLNNLATFDMPVVVRSVEVQRRTQTERPSRARGGDNTFDALFGGEQATVRGGQGTLETGSTQRPVIEDNESEYTVTLEYIEVTLPDGNSQ